MFGVLGFRAWVFSACLQGATCLFCPFSMGHRLCSPGAVGPQHTRIGLLGAPWGEIQSLLGGNWISMFIREKTGVIMWVIRAAVISILTKSP